MKKHFLVLILSFTTSGIVMAQSESSLHKELLATWKKHTEMTALLLNGIDAAYLADQSSSGGRNVGEQFAHMHNVRLMWVGEMIGVSKDLDTEIEDKGSLNKEYLLKQLTLSNEVISGLLDKALKADSKFGEMSPVRFMGYLIAHEAHTRGQIVLAMKQSDHALPPQVTYGIWQW